MQSRLSGPSRLAFPARPQSIDATSSGVLGALSGTAITENPDVTGVELPYGLMTTPGDARQEGAPAVLRHPASPVTGDGNMGLWRTRIGQSSGDGGLRLSNARRLRSDTFPVALTRASRSQIELQDIPPRADRLELSSLGGSLTASGKWETFEWDHQASLGRDHYVRTATKGVLYPFGHRAVFVELSERSVDEPIAVLRKRRSIYISEPTRRRPSRAFPFREVEMSALEFNDIDDPSWTKVGIPLRAIAELEARADVLGDQLSDLYRSLRPPDGWMQPGATVIERLVMGQAWSYIEGYAELQRLKRHIAIMREGGLGEDPVEVLFMPHVDRKPLLFPVRAAATNRDLHFSLPLIFVADIQTRAGTHASYTSLTDSRVENLARRTYDEAKAGVVQLQGVPLNVSPSSDGTVAPSDVQEVHRINIMGHSAGLTFDATLGGRNAEAWAAEIGVPTVRSLIGGDPKAEVKFDTDYLAGSSTEVALRVLERPGPDGVPEFINLNFTANSDRTGGLISPNSVADGISRVKGLVNVDAIQQRVADTIDPAELFANGASLFGFPLWDLVKDIEKAPEVVTILTEGQPPTVRMTWDDIVLKESAGGAFLPREPQNGVPSRLTLSVVSSPTLNETVCTLTNFMLAMPPGSDRLIEISFDRVEFTQRGGQPPNLSMNGLNATLTGKLKLLQVLQEKVGLGDLGPKIEPSPTGITARFAVPIPDVSALAFVMSNLRFSASLLVPFNGEPVALGLGFASREKPFTLTVLMFGGGGYVDLELIHTGLRRLEISLQFGAAIAIGFGIGNAEVHAFGGIRFTLLPGRGVVLTGFIHIGGSVDILGLISVSVELRVELDYQFETNSLVGRAKLVIEIDITLFSESVELDSGEWVIAGGSAERSLPPPGPTISRRLDVERRGSDDWRAYRRSFA